MHPVNLRDKRRTTVIEMTNSETGHLDQIRLCEPDCRNYFLSDLGIPGNPHGGGWMYKSHGNADVTVAWSKKSYGVTWKRVRPTDIPCDHCDDAWMTHIPALVADAEKRSQDAKLRGTVPPMMTRFTAA